MKKVITIFLLIISLVSTSFIVAYADYPVLSHNGNFSEFGCYWGVNRPSNYTRLSYDSLCELCSYFNSEMCMPCSVSSFADSNTGAIIYYIRGTGVFTYRQYQAVGNGTTLGQLDITGRYCTDVSGHLYMAYYNTDNALFSSLDGTVYSVADYTRHIFNRLGTINEHLESWLTSVDSDSGKSYSVAAWTKHVFNRLGTIDSHFSDWLTSVDNDSGKTYSVADWTRHIYNRLGTVSTTLGGKIDNVYTRLGTTNTYIDGVEGKLDTVNTRLNTVNATAAQGFFDVSGNLSGILTSVDGVGGKLDTVIDLMTTSHYFTGFSSDTSGNAFPTQSIPYDAAVQIVAKFNSDMMGKTVTVLKRDGSGTLEVTVARAALQASGRITVYTTGTSNYWLCDSKNTIFVAEPKTDYTPGLTAIYDRMSDMISAVNNLTVGVDLTDVQLSVDASSINFNTYNGYCCSYLSDANGSAYSTYAIPYDTATDIVARLNTEYVGQRLTLLLRSGGTSYGVIRSATLLPSGYIQIKFNSGNTYYLCDNSNVIFKSYDSPVQNVAIKLNDLQSTIVSSTYDDSALLAKLDVINNSINNISTTSTVIQDIQQNGDDVNDGLTATSRILTLVRGFFNPGGIQTNWGEAKNYAMQWGSD